MALLFDGVDDEIRCAISSPANVAFGSYAAIVRKNGGDGSNTNFFRQVESGLTARGGLFLVGNTVTAQWNGLVSGSTLVVADNWALVTASKATGNVTTRFYKYIYGTDTETFTTSASTTNGTAPGTTGTYRLGSRDAGPYWNGDMLVAAVWDRALTDIEMQNLRFSLQHWYTSTPVGLWLMDQSDTTQAVIDATGNGGNETTRTGTAIATNNPPIWNMTDGVWPVHRSPTVVTRSLPIFTQRRRRVLVRS